MTFRGGFKRPVATNMDGSGPPADTNMDRSKPPADRDLRASRAKSRRLMGIMRPGGEVDVTKYPNPYGSIDSKPSRPSLSGTPKPGGPNPLPVPDDGADVTVTHSTAPFDASKRRGAGPGEMSANAGPGYSGRPKCPQGVDDAVDVTKSSNPYGVTTSGPSRVNATDPRNANDRPGAEHAADVSLIVNVGAAPSYAGSVEPGAAAVTEPAAAGPGDSGSPKGHRGSNDQADVTASLNSSAPQSSLASGNPAIAPAKRQTANNRRWPRDARPIKDHTAVVKPELAGRTGYRVDDRLGLENIHRLSRQNPNFAWRPAIAGSNGGGSMSWKSPDVCGRPPSVPSTVGGARPQKDPYLNWRLASAFFNGGGAGSRNDVDLNWPALEANAGRQRLEEKGAGWPLEGKLT